MSLIRSTPSRLLDGDSAEVLAWWEPRLLDQVAQCVGAAWSKWTQNWIGSPVPVLGQCGCTLAHESCDRVQAHWDAVGTRGQAAAWIEVRYNPIAQIQEALFGPEQNPPAPSHEGSIAQAVASRAWVALSDVLRECLSLECDATQPNPAAGCFKPWSGCVLVSLPAAGVLTCSLLLNSECVRALLGPAFTGAPAGRRVQQPTAVTPLREALADHKLSIQVTLAGCDLDLGLLESLRVGDIVPLPHLLDAPLLVSTAQDEPFCAAFLGRRAGSKAVELVREPASGNCLREFDQHPLSEA